VRRGVVAARPACLVRVACSRGVFRECAQRSCVPVQLSACSAQPRCTACMPWALEDVVVCVSVACVAAQGSSMMACVLCLVCVCTLCERGRRAAAALASSPLWCVSASHACVPLCWQEHEARLCCCAIGAAVLLKACPHACVSLCATVQVQGVAACGAASRGVWHVVVMLMRPVWFALRGWLAAGVIPRMHAHAPRPLTLRAGLLHAPGSKERAACGCSTAAMARAPAPSPAAHQRAGWLRGRGRCHGQAAPSSALSLHARRCSAAACCGSPTAQCMHVFA
jgi:hypothetical protein